MKLKKITIYISIILIFLLSLSTIKVTHEKDDLTYCQYIKELQQDYGDDKKQILKKINKEINNNQNTKKYIGLNMLVRQHYFYVWEDNENFMNYNEETENYLIKYNMEEELLHLYSITSTNYIAQERYNEGYLYIYRGEQLAKKMYEKNQSKETLATLVEIKYFKAVIALDIGMEDTANIKFNEAEELRKENNIEGIDVYFNILLYHHNKQKYDLVEEYALKLIKLIEDKDLDMKNYEHEYNVSRIILAENYIYMGQIDKSVEIANELSNDENILSNKCSRCRVYNLYAQIYKYYGNSQEYIKYLEMIYDYVKDSNVSLKKIKLVRTIIEELEIQDNQEGLLYWYKLESEIFKGRYNSLDIQYLMSQLINNDLQSAKYNIEILKLKESKMIYVIVTLALITIIIIILIIIISKRKRILEENINILERNSTIKQQYYENIKLNYENIRRIKHDIKNHIISINTLISEKHYEEAKKYIRHIENNIDYSCLDISTNNKIVDAIVFSKMETCKLENIDLYLDIKVPKEVSLDEFDICVIYGNLLDNAIQACKKVNEKELKRYIKLKNFVKGDYLFINIKNSYNEKIKVKDGNFITSKKDKENHGIGIESVKKSIKKYDGNIKISYEKKEFSVSIIIPITK